MKALYKIAYSPNPAAVVVNEPLDQLVSPDIRLTSVSLPVVPRSSTSGMGTTLLLQRYERHTQHPELRVCGLRRLPRRGQQCLWIPIPAVTRTWVLQPTNRRSP